jgi:cobyrinic acid a,c-diamide synthase
VALSAIAALRRRGHSVSVFKKGPDYIDPAWLSLVGQAVCRSLDTYMVDRDAVLRNFVLHSHGADISVIEGNRGLYDGKNVAGTHSTAELAKLLEAPVVLVVNAAKATRTVAAVVKGCVDFDPDVKIAGVVLNRVAGKRHLGVLERSIKEYSGLPVLGAIPKLGEDSALIPGRHLGLVTPAEFNDGAGLESRLRDIAESHLDVDAMIGIAKSAAPVSCVPRDPSPGARDRVKIGFFKDSVFTFYYPENLEALKACGAELVPVSSLADGSLPEVDALYIGGGFPETHAEQLAHNKPMMESIRRNAERGLPIYAECGGLIYLARSLEYGGRIYPMTGLFPIDLAMHQRPVGHGYTQVVVDAPNPFYGAGIQIRGHEFHYSGPKNGLHDVKTCMKVESGVGVGDARDGLVFANTLACYTHVHADGAGSWASSMVARATDYAAKRRRGATDNSGTNSGPESAVL